MTMSRPELDGHLAALSKLNGNRSGKKDPAAPTHQTFKSRRNKRKKGKQKHGR